MKEFDYKRVDSSMLKFDVTAGIPENPFFNKKVVLTGDMETWDRSAAAYFLQKLGADVNTSISKKTQIVVVAKGAGPSKLDKIIDLLDEGIEIKLINERMFNLITSEYKHLIEIS